MSASPFVNVLLKADAIANVGLAAMVLVFLRVLTDAAGLAGGWPAAVLAGVLLGNGLACWRITRVDPPAPGAVRGLAAVDAAFTIVVLWFASADPTGIAAWLRVVLVGLAIGVATVAAAKLLVAVRLQPTGATAQRRGVSEPVRRSLTRSLGRRSVAIPSSAKRARSSVRNAGAASSEYMMSHAATRSDRWVSARSCWSSSAPTPTHAWWRR